MPVKLLATNPFAEPARLEYEPSPSPAMRTYRWKRPLGVLPQHLRPTTTAAVASASPRTQARTYAHYHQVPRSHQDVRQLFSVTQAATEQLRQVAQQSLGYREQTKSCDLDAYRIGTPSYGVNNNNNSGGGGVSSPGQRSNCRTQFPNIKADEGSSRGGFEHRLGRQTYSRTEVLLRLQRRKKTKPDTGSPSGSGSAEAGGVPSQDLPVISAKPEPSTCALCSCGGSSSNSSSSSSYTARSKTDTSKDTPTAVAIKSQTVTTKLRRASNTSTSKGPYIEDPDPTESANSDGSGHAPRSPGHNSEESKATPPSRPRRLGFVEVQAAKPILPREGGPESPAAVTPEDRSGGTSSPVVSVDADSVCQELQKIVLRRTGRETSSTPYGPGQTGLVSGPDSRWPGDRDGDGDSRSPASTDSDRFAVAMQALQPPVPHVVWPENKFYSSNTVFVYASPSRLAPMVIPSHSVDCPQCKFYQASPKGDVCPPNSPTPCMQKDFGFYPVERHFGCK